MKVKHPIPKTKGFDKTRKLIKEGFEFIPHRREQLQSDIFETRLIGQKAVCMAGEEAAEIFYDNEKFKRAGAMPKPLKMALFGEGAVHEQDGEHHKQRKRMFLSMMTPERIEDMRRIVIEELDKKADEWETKAKVVLHYDIEEVLSRAASRWAGIPLREEEVKQRTWEMSAMIASISGKPSGFKDGKKARESHEKWLEEHIKNIRKGNISAEAYTPSYIVAHHHDDDGKRLKLNTAAVELSNAFRPLLAAAYFITFGALAVHQYPETGEKLREDKNNYSQMFTQEVRRFYPFTPGMVAKVKSSFTWQGYKFKKNRLVVLDFFGTNRHPDTWEKPDQFIPERFHKWKESPFSFIPMGGGDHHTGHRCAGEWLTVIVMRAVFQYLTTKLSYHVPEQDLSYDLNEMPAVPKSRFIITDILKTNSDNQDIHAEFKGQTVIQH
ncbi:cytochrome P450 [Alkalicoccus saliphilus]|uniref:Cytochrome P450 n=1 Tax=Alkalicoccus saliphilus TaxID=200989 RepID=A0A2T4UA32_9BACI|nr:cytochrome P450 [Alkalicoccus saliphilus]PTL40257.1 cytochrome P450 [Alkalicoccus saliphilus]